MKHFFSIFLVFLFSFPATALALTECEKEVPISHSLKIEALYPNPSTDEVEWIKLKNTGANTLDLSFYTLEDETGNPWELTASIESLATLKLENFPFQLNNGGDTVTLKTLDGEYLDSMTYSSSEKSQIITGEQTQSTDTPTETTPELPQLTPELWPIFSEALPNPEGSDSTDEWIELYNPYEQTLILDGLKLDDVEGGSSAYKLTGSLAQESFLLLWIEDTGITLNNTSDSIRLLGVNNEVLWDIPYDSSKEGEAYAYFDTFYDWTNRPSPGSDNLLMTVSEETQETEFTNGDLSESIELTEVFPNPEGPDQDAEWIEIINGGSETVNLGNWIIDDGEGGSAPYILPDDTILGPGETLVIERGESGIALNNSNETVQIIDFTGEVMDEITYESTEEGMSYAQIEIEKMSNEQASLADLGSRFITTWEWVLPTPGENNPKWKQFKGEVIDFDGTYLTLFDGISNWSLKAASQKTDELFFQNGNTILARVAMQNGIYEIMYSELLESVKTAEKQNFPWPWVLIGLFASLYFGFDLYKKQKQKNTFPSTTLTS